MFLLTFLLVTKSLHTFLDLLFDAHQEIPADCAQMHSQVEEAEQDEGIVIENCLRALVSICEAKSHAYLEEENDLIEDLKLLQRQIREWSYLEQIAEYNHAHLHVKD